MVNKTDLRNTPIYIDKLRYSVNVDYDKTVDELIKAANFDSENKFISDKTFLSTERGRATVDIYMLSFYTSLESKVIIKEIDKHGFHPITLKELLTLAATYPLIPKTPDGSIVALGSTLLFPYNHLSVPHLFKMFKKRRLELVWYRGLWTTSFIFAVVPKNPTP